jgi:lipopolysaccharide transport system ATP-binding protein
MSDTAILVENLGKRYRIGETVGYKMMRDTIANMARLPFRRFRQNPVRQPTSPRTEYIWALKNVSFAVKKGEVVGMIGRNGAGKSTLLKVLSRITVPTEGSVDMYGNVGCLLEVGTGFHPELTGRENIYLNGAVLGMKRTDIAQRFDAIVEFSGVKKFLDTPVKHYSSGMYVRLAFSVAAHMEPEILIVDEVLSVGDAEFQQKCLGKMSEVAGEGRTVIFVSHAMDAIKRLCTRAILFKDGKVDMDGKVDEVVAHYMGPDRNVGR